MDNVAFTAYTLVRLRRFCSDLATLVQKVFAFLAFIQSSQRLAIKATVTVRAAIDGALQGKDVNNETDGTTRFGKGKKERIAET